jgi:hypothetical protein
MWYGAVVVAVAPDDDDEDDEHPAKASPAATPTAPTAMTPRLPCRLLFNTEPLVLFLGAALDGRWLDSEIL